jgi:hypothetical protein
VDPAGRIRASWRPQSGFCREPGLWVQASLDYKQRLRQLFFPKGVASDGTRFNRTAPTAPLSTFCRELAALRKA